LLELIRARSGEPEYYIRYMECFKMDMMHTKLITMKWGMFWSILQVAGVN
jgi:hypothetical protein